MNQGLLFAIGSGVSGVTIVAALTYGNFAFIRFYNAQVDTTSEATAIGIRAAAAASASDGGVVAAGF